MNLDEFDRIVRALQKQRDPAIQFIAYLRDISENADRWEKYRDSFSGNIISLNIVTCENALILLCCRIWEKQLDQNTIPNAISAMQSTTTDAASTELFRDHLARNNVSETYPAEISALAKDLANDPIIPVIRVMRNENLAHSIDNSRYKKKYFPDGFENHGVSRNSLFEFAEKSVHVIDNLELIRSGTNHDYHASLKVFQKYCASYWNALPIFRQIE